MAKDQVYICGMGAVTPVGMDPMQTAASVRAGLSRSQQSDIYDKHFEPFVLSLLPDEELPELAEELEQKVGLTSRQVRLLRLAAPAITQALSTVRNTEHIPLFLGGPKALAGREPAIDDRFIPNLIQQAILPLDQSKSEVFPLGQAAGLVALEKAMTMVKQGTPYVLVGGVDTFLDLYLLGTLDSENRILGPRVMDGFIPGEGSAFVLVGKRPPDNLPPLVIIAATQGFEKGHLYSEEPYKGEGLADTLATLFAPIPQEPKIKTVFASLNGENFGAKEWGVAYMRSSDRFNEPIRLEHPVDCFGDPGAALGPLLTILAAIGLQKEYLSGPCLSWCSSDYGTRAAAIIDKI